MNTSDLENISREVRKDLLKAIHRVGTGHPGSSLSTIEILVSLYFKHMNINPLSPNMDDRDRFIMSKGHGAPGLYSVLANRGYFPKEELYSLRQFGSRLQGHPKMDSLPGIDFSTGSLGQGLSAGLGMSMALRERNNARVFCLLGDGEIQEGQNWEAAMAASSFKATNLIVIIDRNGLQNDKTTEEIVQIEDLPTKFRAFGWNAERVDGHDFSELLSALESASVSDAPTCIVADTIKGKGVSYMENQIKWHHHPITDDELSIALSEL